MHEGRLSELCGSLTSWVVSRPRRALGIALLATLVCGVTALRLDVDATLTALLPDDGSHAAAYRTFLEVFGEEEEIFVLVGLMGETSADDQAVADGVVLDALFWLEERLSASERFVAVRSGIEAEDEVFLRDAVLAQAPLLVESASFDDLLRVLDDEALSRRRAAEVRRRVDSPASTGIGALLRSDPFGLADEILGGLSGGLPTDPFTGSFVSADGRLGLIFGTLDAATLDAPGRRALLGELEALDRELRSAFDPEGRLSLGLRALGPPLYAAWDEIALRRDLSVTLSMSLLLSLLALALGLRSVIVPLVAGLTLAVAGVWTVGILAVVRGEVLALGFGFSAVLVGLGVDALIHGAGRWRREGPASLVEAARRAGPGIVVALSTSAVAFFGLQLASLRLVRDVGLLVGIGLVAVLIATGLVAAPLGALGSGTPSGRKGLAPWLVELSERPRRLATRAPLAVVGAFVLLVALAGWSARGVQVLAEVSSLRPVDHPAAATEVLLAEEFGFGPDSVQFLAEGPDLGAALATAGELAAELRRGHPEAEISSPADLLPGGAVAERRSRLADRPLREVRRRYEEALRAEGLSPAAFSAALDVFEQMGTADDPLGSGELPVWLRRQLSVGTGGARVLVTARAATPVAARAVARTGMRENVLVSASSLVGEDLQAGAERDLRTLVSVALVAVLGVLLLAFRGQPQRVFVALLPVLVGSLAATAWLAATGAPLDLLGVSMLPVLVGLGLDDGVHATLGARERSQLSQSVRESGPAMTLTTLTTCLGFGSLAFSEIPSLARAGVFIAVGVFACWLTTVALLPALGGVARARGES